MRVLVVEDDEMVAAGLQRGLGEAGFIVDVAGDGDTGFWMASEHDFDVVVLDVMLPARNGYNVCRDLRAAGIDTPILMLTAKSGEFDEAEGLDLGADDFLRKPFSIVVLIARVRALVRRRTSEFSAEVVSSDGLSVDFERRLCWRDGVAIDLTNREFALLEALVRRRGTARSKESLLNEVWGPSFEGGPNVVEVYIGYLRRKLDAGHELQLLQTVHGYGYRLIR